MSFKAFLETDIDSSRQIRKNWGKSYKPGTFGIEIEYRAATEHESEVDLESAREVFDGQSNAPPSVEDWESDNPEPDKPDKEDYQWHKDRMRNYYNFTKADSRGDSTYHAKIKFGMEGSPNIFDPDIIWGDELSIISNRWVKEQIKKLMINMNHLREMGHDDTWKRKMFMSEEEWAKFYSAKRQEIYFLTPQAIENREFQMNHTRDFETRDAYKLPPDQEKLIKDITDKAFEFIDKFRDYHDAKAEAIQKDEYKSTMYERYKEDWLDYKEKKQEWSEERAEVERTFDAYDDDEAFDNWLSRHEDRFTVRTNDDPNTEEEIREIKRWFKGKGLKTQEDKGGDDYSRWNVFEDEEGVVEIASPILNVSSFGFLKELLGEIRHKEFDNRTGLHVHIGMPKTTDAFDLLAMVYLTDEKAILQHAGRDTDALTRYAQTKKELFANLANIPEKVYTNEELLDALQGRITRYQGVNFIQAFSDMGTVEFRYLTSQIVKDPEILFKLINYFLMLPRLAQGRSQLRIPAPGEQFIDKTLNIAPGILIFSRRPGGKIEVKRFAQQQKPPQGQKGPKTPKPKSPKSPQPVQQLRQPEEPQELKDKLLTKHGIPTIWGKV